MRKSRTPLPNWLYAAFISLREAGIDLEEEDEVLEEQEEAPVV